MKIALKTILGFLVIAAFTACEDDEATQPHAAMSVGKYIYDTNETMKIHFTGSAENVVIYTGDTDHDYELRERFVYIFIPATGHLQSSMRRNQPHRRRKFHQTRYLLLHGKSYR